MRNKQRHALEDYENDALASLHKNLKAKWDFITMQAKERLRQHSTLRKSDKIVYDSQVSVMLYIPQQENEALCNCYTCACVLN